ncbi:MAG: sulfatase-like hydrolase/transferase [Bacteroidales bacterium]|nr:sulfatase-like hydrolase/transferase [Bacteroidales bacterium]
MNHLPFDKLLLPGTVLISITTVGCSNQKGNDQPENPPRPNIIWIVSEDNSPLLGCYGDKIARTPNIDKLASEGIVYDNAFSNAPVSAPSRSTLITGMYANSLGTQHMRCENPVPDFVRFFQNI